MTIVNYQPIIVLSEKEYNVVGTRPIRHDGAHKVTGRAQYGADFYTAGLLHGKLLRSPHAHAVIRSLDTSKAEALPGVRAVVTARELPETPAGPGGERKVTLGELSTDLRYLRDGILARDTVGFKGHPIAGVAAASAHVAEEALELIEVEYEVLPAVLTAPEAMKEDAPLLHDDLTTEEFGEKTGNLSNVAQHFRHSLGDIDKGFAEADVIVEREFTRRRSTRAISSPTTAPCTGTRTTGFSSGTARKVPSTSGTPLRRFWTCRCRRSDSRPWKSAAVSAGSSSPTANPLPPYSPRRPATQ